MNVFHCKTFLTFVFITVSLCAFGQSYPAGTFTLKTIQHFVFDKTKKAWVVIKDDQDVKGAMIVKKNSISFTDGVVKKFIITSKKIDDSYNIRTFNFELRDTKDSLHRSTVSFLKKDKGWYATMSLTGSIKEGNKPDETFRYTSILLTEVAKDWVY